MTHDLQTLPNQPSQVDALLSDARIRAAERQSFAKRKVPMEFLEPWLAVTSEALALQSELAAELAVC